MTTQLLQSTFRLVAVAALIVLAFTAGYFIKPFETYADSAAPALEVIAPTEFTAVRKNAGFNLVWSVPEDAFAEDIGADCVPRWHRSYEIGLFERDKHPNELPSWRTVVLASDEKYRFKDREWGNRFNRGERYNFRVRVVAMRTADPDRRFYSDWVYADALYPETARARPGVPQNLTDTRDSAGVTLSWDASSDNSITEYRLRRAEIRDGRQTRIETFFKVSNMHSLATRWTDTTAQPGTDYAYFIRAKNNRGYGGESNGAYTDD